MSSILNKDESWFAKCKRTLLENLWIIFLLTPLLIIAFLISKHYQPAKHKVMLTKRSSNFSLSIEITTAELAIIVAKPIGELLAMDVYNDYKKASNTNLLMAKVEVGGNVENEAYNKAMLKIDGERLYAKTKVDINGTQQRM
jgi:hypothetical protein